MDNLSLVEIDMIIDYLLNLKNQFISIKQEDDESWMDEAAKAYEELGYTSEGLN